MKEEKKKDVGEKVQGEASKTKDPRNDKVENTAEKMSIRRRRLEAIMQLE